MKISHAMRLRVHLAHHGGTRWKRGGLVAVSVDEMPDLWLRRRKKYKRRVAYVACIKLSNYFCFGSKAYGD
jgi:hypothetical protein